MSSENQWGKKCLPQKINELGVDECQITAYLKAVTQTVSPSETEFTPITRRPWLGHGFMAISAFNPKILITAQPCRVKDRERREHNVRKKTDLVPALMESSNHRPKIHFSFFNPYKYWCWCWNSNTLATWCKELTHWKRPWCWERLKTGEGDDRGWDGWMASPTRWTRVWVSSGSLWTGKPGVLQSMGSQRVRHDSYWADWLNPWI